MGGGFTTFAWRNMVVGATPLGNFLHGDWSHGPVEIVDLAIENGDFQQLCKRLPEGISTNIHVFCWLNLYNHHEKSHEQPYFLPIDIVMQTKCFGLNDQILIRHEGSAVFLRMKRQLRGTVEGQLRHGWCGMISTYILNHWGFLGGLVAENEKHGKKYISGWWFGTMEFYDFWEIVGNGKSSQLTNSVHHFSEG